MAFSRKSIVAAFAGTLSIALAAGCQNTVAPTQPSTAPSSSMAPSTAPSGSTAPTTAPSGATGTVAPSTTPSAPNIGSTTFSGTVYDELGATVSGAKVEAKSLNASAPFDTTVDVNNGNYVINGVPAGVSVQVTVTKTGYTSRSRVVTLLPLSSAQPNVVDFGGANDTAGAAYFISDYPEVTSVSPADKSTGNSPTTYKYVLTLSEPLDSTNQARFKNEIRVWPDNQYAVPSGGVTPTDLRALTATVATTMPLSTSAATGSTTYVIDNSSAFGDPATTTNTASVSFDSTGQVATLTFNAPLIANNDNTARYQIGLVQPKNASPVDDGNGHQLGLAQASVGSPVTTDSGFGQLSSSSSDQLIYDAFQSPSLSVTKGDFGVKAWTETHVTTTYFDLTQDNTLPTLTAVSVDKVNNASRINLTFSKPMAAYMTQKTNGEFVQSSATDPTNYIFAFGRSSGDVSGVDLNVSGTVATTTLADVYGTGGSPNNTGKAVTLSNVSIDVDPNNPAVIRLTGTGASDVLNSDLSAIKVYVKNVQDPAGNVINANNSTNVQTGSI